MSLANSCGAPSMSDDRPNIQGPGIQPEHAQSATPRAAPASAQPAAVVVSAQVLASIAAFLTISAGGGWPSKGATNTDSASSATHRISGASDPAPTAIVSGGPLAPVAVGGRAALWAPHNVVGYQPGTAAAYTAASKLAGLPGYLLIADRGNNRILVVNPAGSDRVPATHSARTSPPGSACYLQRRHLRRARRPRPDRQRRGLRRRSSQVGIADRSPDTCCSAIPGVARRRGQPPELPPTTPTCWPAAPSRWPTPTTAGSSSCAHHRIVRQYGTLGRLPARPAALLRRRQRRHADPRRRRARAERDHRLLDRRDLRRRQARGRIKVPVAYPSDPQPLPGGRILLGRLLRPRAHRRDRPPWPRVWRYGPSRRARRAWTTPRWRCRLPNGDIAVNDDYRDRVIVIDPRTKRIVWQYGHTDKPGTAPGYLNIARRHGLRPGRPPRRTRLRRRDPIPRWIAPPLDPGSPPSDPGVPTLRIPGSPRLDPITQRRRFAKRRARRRRLVASLAGLVGVAIVVVLLAGGGEGKGGGVDTSQRGDSLARAHARESPSGANTTTPPAGTPAAMAPSPRPALLPAPVQDAAAAVVDPDRFLLMGGIDRSEASVADILQASPTGAQRIGTLPQALHDASASTLGGAVYLLGGGVRLLVPPDHTDRPEWRDQSGRPTAPLRPPTWPPPRSGTPFRSLAATPVSRPCA